MKILNIGSLNLDYVYGVDHIILPGETEATSSRNVFLGGKGLNQSCALAKAGAEVHHCGLIGSDGQMFLEACKEYGIHTEHIRVTDGPSGHTVIQIDKNAQNSILLFGGANQKFTKEHIDSALSSFDAPDILLLQNEINLLPYIVDRAWEKGMTVVLNPSPYNEKLDDVDLGKISLFILNEVEGHQITGSEDAEGILEKMLAMYPRAKVLLTLGRDGAVYADAKIRYFQPSFPVKAVDTTAAGDTFTGYFLAGLTEGMPIPEILKMSAKAAAIAVSREGAVPSIPYRREIPGDPEESTIHVEHGSYSS